MNYIVYDVEIAKEVEDVPGKWDNPEGMGLSSAVAYDYARDVYRFFYEEEGKKQLLELLNGNVAVGFNSIRFDSRVILGNNRRLIPEPPRWTDTPEVGFRNYDIMLEYFMSREQLTDVEQAFEVLAKPETHAGGKFNLDAMAKATLGSVGKLGHGAFAPVLYKEGRIPELFQYNLQDVRLTKQLFNFILDHGHVKGADGREVRMPHVNMVSRGFILAGHE